MFGNFAPISWKSHKQLVAALSSTEAEYMAMVEATKEALHLLPLLASLDLPQGDTTNPYVDNQSAVALAKNTDKRHNWSKHIDLRYHFIRQHTDTVYTYIDTNNNLADEFTKPFEESAHMRHRDMLFQLEGHVNIQAYKHALVVLQHMHGLIIYPCT